MKSTRPQLMKEAKALWIKTKRTWKIKDLVEAINAKSEVWQEPTKVVDVQPEQKPSQLEQAMAMMMTQQTQQAEMLSEINKGIQELCKTTKQPLKPGDAWFDSVKDEMKNSSYKLEYQYMIQKKEKNTKLWGPPTYEIFWSKFDSKEVAVATADKKYGRGWYRIIPIPQRSSM